VPSHDRLFISGVGSSSETRIIGTPDGVIAMGFSSLFEVKPVTTARNKRAIAALRALRERDIAEQQADWEVLKQTLDEDRLSDRPRLTDE
jgi:hypothetical protein